MTLRNICLKAGPIMLIGFLILISWETAMAINAPTGLTARSTGTSTVLLKWADKSGTETGFQVWRKSAGEGYSGAYELLTTTGSNVTEYVDSGAVGNRTTISYSYYIQACRDAVCSAATSEAVVPNPNTLTLTALGPQINLEWKDISSPNTATRIERRDGKCSDTGTWAPLVMTGTNTTSFSDKDVVAGLSYSYRLKATYQSPTLPYAKGYSAYTGCRSLTVPTAAPPGAVVLPETGQTTCYDSGGNIIGCGFTGQDAAAHAGAAWPATRFVPGTGTEAECMIDTLTGLMWPKNASPRGYALSWQEALTYSNSLDLCGHTDWHLPNINELACLLNRQEPTAAWLIGQGFNSVQSFYWSSTTDAGSPAYTWGIAVNFSAIVSWTKSSFSGRHAWPVRSAGVDWGNPAARLPKTGQTACYLPLDPYSETDCLDTGQDGEIQAGTAWPIPRFVSGTGTETDCVRDRLTGLMWPKNGNLLKYSAATWQTALDYAKNLDLCGHADWRLPNVNEMRSLINAQEADTAAWLNAQGFNNVHSYYYWTSTTAENMIVSNAWFVDMWGGFCNSFNGASPYSDEKGDFYYAWPVRSIKGQP